MKFQEALSLIGTGSLEIKRTPWRYNTMRKVDGVLTYFRNGVPSTRTGSNELSLESLTAEDWVTVPLATVPTTTPETLPFPIPAGFRLLTKWVRDSEYEHFSRANHVCANYDSVYNTDGGSSTLVKVYVLVPNT